MSIIKVEIRSSAYYDSVILMHLQRALATLPDIIDAGAIMGTEANKHLLVQSGLSAPDVDQASPDDLVIVVKAASEKVAADALKQVDELIEKRRQTTDTEYRPKSLETAVKMLPGAHWVLISVPGRYAADVTREALGYGRNVFLYSDNVSLEDEIDIKRKACELGLMVMGPDCGTAIINHVGLGFANAIRPGPIGLVAASGTGLQQVSSRIHQLGSGITHALGTGGRDLSKDVSGLSTLQGFDLLDRDDATGVIVLISKPPSTEVAERLLRRARRSGKPVVVDFIGHSPVSPQLENLFFSTSFDSAAKKAVELAGALPMTFARQDLDIQGFAPGQRYLRGLFSGGTLAYEALLILQDYLPAVYANIPIHKELRLPDSLISQEHTILDLGEDEFTVGRLHPMMDHDLRIRRLEAEAEDPEVAVILMDVVLGFGAHIDPAGELSPAIRTALQKARSHKRRLDVIVVLVGTDEDPQDMNAQAESLRAAGAYVETSNELAVRRAGEIAARLSTGAEEPCGEPVKLEYIQAPFSAINIGLESFSESLSNQGAAAIQVDWRPPASGNEALMSILERMKAK
jgi:FdrA protein